MSDINTIPAAGEFITAAADGTLNVPDRPIIGFISGDGVGPEVAAAARFVWENAVRHVYGGRRRIAWQELAAGESAEKQYGAALPDATIDALRRCLVAIKGPLATPVGGGRRSLNVTLRRELDLYACVRPVRYYPGVPSPVRHPERLDVVIFRENTEDLYAGIEWAAGTPEAARFARFLSGEMGVKLPHPETSGFGVKPISREGSARLMRAALDWAFAHGRRKVTVVHKGNIMKYTAGGFRAWAFDVVRGEYGDRAAVAGDPGAEGKLLVDDRICDDFLQQALLAPTDFDVIAAPNLNGDYISDALAAQVGGIGISPGANINFTTGAAIFEATHGTAPKLAGLDSANPSSLILSGAMMLEHLGWREAADTVDQALRRTIGGGTMTADLVKAGGGDPARGVGCAAFARAVVENLN